MGDSPIPIIVLHLDHMDGILTSRAAAIAGGYTSVMIRRVVPAFDENVELTREVVKYAHARRASAWKGSGECWPGWRTMYFQRDPLMPIP